MAPQEVELPGTRPTERLGGQTVDTTKSSAPAHPSSDKKPDDLLEAHYSCLERLEDDLRHADLSIEERCELEERVLRLRRKLGPRPTSREPTGPGSYGALASLLPYPVDRGLSASSPRFFS
jgi:hypothetical protein